MDLGPWQHDSADSLREEEKRKASPGSFFFSQGRALVLAAGYFTGGLSGGYAGTARKHLHRIHLALFGQLMASLEYLLKDFIAKVVDLIPTFDEEIRKADWITLEKDHVLLGRSAQASPGAILLHPTLGWQDPESVNRRYKALFNHEPIAKNEYSELRQLWILRHSVAHNAGFVTAYDAARGSLPSLSEHVADLTEDHLRDAFAFLSEVARRVAEDVGHKVVIRWLKSRKPLGADYQRDKETYVRLRLLATYVQSRTQSLPSVGKGRYTADFAEASK